MHRLEREEQFSSLLVYCGSQVVTELNVYLGR